MLYVPRSWRGSVSRPYCPSRWPLRLRGPSSVPPSPCTAGWLRSCIDAAASYGTRSPPSAVPVSGTLGNRGGHHRVRDDARSRRTASYSAASTSDGSRQTENNTISICISFCFSRLLITRTITMFIKKSRGTTFLSARVIDVWNSVSSSLLLRACSIFIIIISCFSKPVILISPDKTNGMDIFYASRICLYYIIQRRRRRGKTCRLAGREPPHNIGNHYVKSKRSVRNIGDAKTHRVCIQQQ